MSRLTHAGGIVVRSYDDGPRYLVVQAAKNPNHWVFAKGHVEADESATEAALREVREEAGVEGQVLDHLGTLSFAQDGETAHVAFYLVQYLRDVPSQEERALRWCGYEEALTLLSFEESCDLLRRAQEETDQILR